jgi:hypothetical protein
MVTSVEQSVVRCFKKFGYAADGRVTSKQMSWQNRSFYRPATEVSGKKDSFARPAPRSFHSATLSPAGTLT